MAEFVSTHYGQEAVEYLAEPLLAGVYGGVPEALSISSVLPRFVALESRLEFPGRRGRALEHRAGVLQLVADLRMDPRALGADAAERDPLRRQALIGVVRPER